MLGKRAADRLSQVIGDRRFCHYFATCLDRDLFAAVDADDVAGHPVETRVDEDGASPRHYWPHKDRRAAATRAG